MDAKPIVLHLDKSNPARLCLERDGKPVDQEQAFREGFVVRPDDAPAVLSWAHTFIHARDFNSI